MSVETAVKYYKDLVLYQYQSQPKAMATIELLIRTALCDLVPLQVQDGFDIENAEGVQLDLIGEYVGLKRMEISWSDDEYRDLIKFKTVLNTSDFSLKSLTEAVYDLFGSGVKIYDERTMSLSYVVDDETADSAVIAANYGLLPSAQGVSISGVFLFDGMLFAFANYSENNGNTTGFADYSTGFNGQHWLQYADKIA
jgi:hypothetical protein